MLNFILANTSTIVVSLILAAILARIVFKQISLKKKGQSGCSACQGCAAAAICPSQEQMTPKRPNLLSH